MKNKKGFTLVELLAVIVVLAIVMGIAAVAITNVLDSTRRNAYVASAKQFIAGAKTLVNSDMMSIQLGEEAIYAPKCESTSNTKKIPLYKIKTENAATDKSSWGNLIKKGKAASGSDDEVIESYVLVTSSTMDADGECSYTYSIYLTDGTDKIGTDAAPVAETALKGSDVTAG